MSPHPVVPFADHYVHVAYQAAARSLTLKTLAGRDADPARLVIEADLCDLRRRLDALHSQVLAALA